MKKFLFCSAVLALVAYIGYNVGEGRISANTGPGGSVSVHAR